MFDEKDLKFHKGLMMLLDEATFHLKAKEIGSFTAIYNWAATLPQKANQTPAAQAAEVKPKTSKSSKKKVTKK